jgi:hypothetical protein
MTENLRPSNQISFEQKWKKVDERPVGELRAHRRVVKRIALLEINGA